MKLTVSMITLNEERAVGKVVEDIRRVAPDAEIFLVDSSSDRTAEIAQQLGCRVLKQFPPKGYGPAMDRALRDASGDVVVTLDCDDTYPVETIPYLVGLIDKGWDLVNATRLARRPKAMPFANYLANRVFAWTARLLHGIKTTDVHSGMRAYRKSMIDRVQWDPNGPALPVDMLILPYRMGFRVTEIPIEYRRRRPILLCKHFASRVTCLERQLFDLLRQALCLTAVPPSSEQVVAHVQAECDKRPRDSLPRSPGSFLRLREQALEVAGGTVPCHG